jgi:NADPH-dependent curcumin reductase CurA
MRGRMSAAKSYAKPVEVGATMVGGTVGEVVASRNPNFAVGDIAMGYARARYRRRWYNFARLTQQSPGGIPTAPVSFHKFVSNGRRPA